MLMPFHNILSFVYLHMALGMWEYTCKQATGDYMCEFNGFQLSLK